MSSRRQRVISSIEASAVREEIMLEEQQRQLIEQLVDLETPMRGRVQRLRGLYVHGPPGRGKSWLTNAFFDAVPTSRKTRVHFHSFFDDLHCSLHDHRGDQRALQRAIDSMVGQSQLLLFDELHVHDPGDARLLTRLLEQVFQRRITVVATSNYSPDSLLPNPIWHHSFLPGISMIKTHLGIFHLSGPTDHREARKRSGTGFAAGKWTTAVEYFVSSSGPMFLAVRDRRFPVVSVGLGQLQATFAQLCGSPVSAIEYLEWSRTYDHWVITGIPRLDHTDEEAQQRFINLVDILVDADVRVTFVSTVGLDEFLRAAMCRPDGFRMSSRMQLLHV